MRNFYNTVGARGKDLFSYNVKAVAQEELILEIFKAKQYMGGTPVMTPFEVLEKLKVMGYDYPITSVRRAITNLTKGNKLSKTNEQKKEEYGKHNFYWKLI